VGWQTGEWGGGWGQAGTGSRTTQSALYYATPSLIVYADAAASIYHTPHYISYIDAIIAHDAYYYFIISLFH